MRKNQIKNRQKRKERNKLKKPVDRTQKRIESLKSSIKINIKVIIIFGFFFILFFLVTLMAYHTDWWKESVITYQSHYYVSGSKGTSDYYIIVDKYDKEWRITWDEDFDQDTFKADVKPGDTLKISWYYWLVGRLVQSLESDDYSYRNFSEAEKIAREDIYIELIFTIISAAVLAIAIIILIRNICEIENLKIVLEEYKKDLEENKDKL